MATCRSIEDESAVEYLANELCRRGWSVPALVVLEAGRPLAFVGGQLLWILQPILGLAISIEKIGHLAFILENPKSFERLITQLEIAQVGE